jgi:uncharacterized membrane protein
MDKFWELLQTSVIVQALITLAVVGATVYLVVSGKPIPDQLRDLTGLVIGFYFGSKLALRQVNLK